MAFKLNQRAYAHAMKLIQTGQVVLDDRDAWTEHRPSVAAENAFLTQHGLSEYGRWFLGIDEEQDPDTKSQYKFLYGDFRRLHRCGVLAAESRASQYRHLEVERAAAHLHEMLEALRTGVGAHEAGHHPP